MADLSTLDVTRPADVDPVSAGASRERETRAATVGSFGVEHDLTGVHAFLLSIFTGLPAAGNAGRIAINNVAGSEQLYLDNGTAWQILHPFNVVLAQNIGNGALSGSFTTVVAQSINPGPALNLLVLASVNITRAVSNTTHDYQITVDSVEIPPLTRKGQNYQMSILPDTMTYNTWGYTTLTAGLHTVEFKAKVSNAATKTAATMALILF